MQAHRSDRGCAHLLFVRCCCCCFLEAASALQAEAPRQPGECSLPQGRVVQAPLPGHTGVRGPAEGLGAAHSALVTAGHPSCSNQRRQGAAEQQSPLELLISCCAPGDAAAALLSVSLEGVAVEGVQSVAGQMNALCGVLTSPHRQFSAEFAATHNHAARADFALFLKAYTCYREDKQTNGDQRQQTPQYKK